MRSRLLRETILPDAFKEHLKTLSETDEAQLLELAKRLPTMFVRERPAVQVKDVARLQRELELSTDQIRAIILATLFLQHELRETKDTVEDVVEDFAESGLIELSAKERVSKYLTRALESWQPVVAKVERRGAYEKAFPIYESMRSSSLQLALFDEEFNIDEDTLEGYRPTVQEMAPVALIRLVLSKFGEEEDVAFLVTKEDLQRMVTFLQFTQKQLETVESTAKLEEKRRD